MRPASYDGVLIEKRKNVRINKRGNANCNVGTYELVTSSLHRSNSKLCNLKNTCCRKECVRNLKYAVHLWIMNKHVGNVFVDKKKVQFSCKHHYQTELGIQQKKCRSSGVQLETSCLVFGITALTNHMRYSLTNCQIPVELVIFNSERDIPCVHWKYKRDQETSLKTRRDLFQRVLSHTPLTQCHRGSQPPLYSLLHATRSSLPFQVTAAVVVR